ncbi:3-carboxy-cis,cis-muconate cycloisomerase [Roseateles cavernae]|uniref:3-carboxy-cis,cis-muconate cycloisomerase n=1 Tax=Roseateles cavernae TaxID=3153578 RepID=UPI0032E3BE8E
MSVLVFEGFLSTPQMLALFDESAIVQAMMDFEAALARAEAKAGVIPQSAAQAIASLCRAELYDVAGLVAASGRAGSLAIPLVKKLTETVALFDPAAAGYVHWGSTSQDVIDTAMVLQTRRALRLIDDDLLSLCGHLLDRAEAADATPMLARTLMQPALVSSLRCKLLNWLMPLLRSAQALRARADEALLLQLGGAAGTLASLGDKADAVASQVAAELRLRLPDQCWHTQRDRWVRLGAELGVMCGSLGKLARDLSLLAQAEVSEMMEGAVSGSGGSSAMPHKRNPVACMQALAAAQRAPQRVAALLACMGQEHERGLGGWQAELAEWTGLLLSSHGALQALAGALAALRIEPERMRANIERLDDLVAAEGLALLLARVCGKARAHQLVEGLSQQVAAQGRPLRLLAQGLWQGDAEFSRGISADELDAVFDVQAAARHADARVHKVLLTARSQWQSLMDQPLAP